MIAAERYVVDANAFDQLVADPDLRRHVTGRVEAGDLELLTNEAILDEVRLTPDLEHRADLLRVPTVVEPLPARWGVSTFGGPDVWASQGEAEAINTTTERHRNDAMILGLAIRLELPLLTSDQGLRRRARERSVEVLHARELAERWGLA